VPKGHILLKGAQMSLDLFFKPRSVAVVGASREKGKVGYEILVSLKRGGYPGPIYPVNPHAAEIEGLPCYKDLKSIGATPDLAVIVIPAKLVPGAIQQCADIGAKAAIVISAGFKETGAAGKSLEEQFMAVARRAGIRVIGPNCLGVMVPGNKLNASFGGDLPIPGDIGFISQSGALLSAILDMANPNGIGFSKMVSFGNKADLNEMDLIAALGDDPETRVITGYLESVSDGARFVNAAEQISRKKPILLMKSGGTAAGARAASSHTGSLAGGDTAYECAFERAGILRCRSIKVQFDIAQALAYQPLPAGPRVAIVTNAGGPGIMAADAIEREGLTFAKLADATQAKLKSRLPPAANIMNPIDVLGDALADRYEFALDAVIDDPNVDTVLVLLTPQTMTECAATAEAIARVSRTKPAKPLLTCFMGAQKVADALALLRKNRIPTYDCPESAAATLKVIAQYVAWRNRPPRALQRLNVQRDAAAAILEHCLQTGRRDIGESESKQILEAYGFRTPQNAEAGSAQDAVRAAQSIGYPVVMKIVSPDITHKSDVGGVKVGLADDRQVTAAFEAMMTGIPRLKPEARLVGVSIQQMCRKPGAQEVILGVNRDPQFGPMLMFGLGGILVEVLKDVSFALAPLTADDARQMIAKTRTYPILKGVRGQAGVDIDAVVEGLLRLSQLAVDFPHIKEVDINPFMVSRPGDPSIAVDGRMSVSRDGQ
jgi:acetyltransferase